MRTREIKAWLQFSTLLSCAVPGKPPTDFAVYCLLCHLSWYLLHFSGAALISWLLMRQEGHLGLPPALSESALPWHPGAYTGLQDRPFCPIFAPNALFRQACRIINGISAWNAPLENPAGLYPRFRDNMPQNDIPFGWPTRRYIAMATAGPSLLDRVL